MGNPLLFPDGVAGYGFRGKGMVFIIAEELRYEQRDVDIAVKLPAGNYRAFDLNENRRLQVVYADKYLTINVPLRAGIAMLLAVVPARD